MNREVQPVLQAIQEIKKAVIGKDDCIVKIMTAILAGGHILIEDIPGVGKTTMALAFSRALGLRQNRIQFTPDVLPSDVVGFSMYQKSTGKFEYQPGAVMCNLLLADEINRTSPKTQSALLEVMEEGKVTVDHVTRELPKPFVVIATQNPVGSAGTSMLPESQLDRFMICMNVGYPDMKYELLDIRRQVQEIYIHDAVYQYMGKLVSATRTHSLIELGISPRGTIALAKMVQSLAFLRGRTYVVPEDVEDVFLDVEAHRIRMNAKARVNQVTAGQVLQAILDNTAKPSVMRK
mgnify:CR=1 FL=1